uniref:Glycine N-acyltransferase-like protein n=1 Tax=Wuchereria bancrofti TaxID=6293 RepID=A0AAF5PMD9_WUCBA
MPFELKVPFFFLKYPTAKFRIFGYPFTESKLWFLLSDDPFRIKFLLIWSLPWHNYKKDEFLDVINQFTKLIELPKEILVINPNYLSDKISIYIKSKTSYTENIYPTYMYYMNEKQQEVVLKEKLCLPSDYHYNDDKPEEDALIINDTWQYADKGDSRCFAEKLRMLPNVIIRYQGQPIAYEIFNINGFFHHHFVHEEHRRQGLGKHVELRLSQKIIQEGFWPCKTVELKNELVVAWSNRSSYWNRYDDEYGNPIIINFNLLR